MALVYRHRRLDTNEVFYVGISKNTKRPYSKINRNKHWLNIVKNIPYSVEILSNDINYEDAKELEVLLIEVYGRIDLKSGSLVNMTNGGEGTLGLIFSDGHKAGISNSLKGKLKPVGFGNTMSNVLRGRKLSLEHRTNISKSRKGVSNSHSKTAVSQYTINNEFIDCYNSIREASKETKADPAHIGAVCRGKRKTAGGYIWKYNKT